MARGMWTGLAAGLQQAQEEKRYQQERQDKLNLLNQERKDKLFGLALKLAPKYATSGALTAMKGTSSNARTSVGAGPSQSFYEAQLKAFNFSDEAIADLSLQGPYAMQAAIETYNEIYDETNPPDQTTLQKIADGIIIENVTSRSINPKEFAKTMGLDLEAFPEEERAMRKAILSGALTPPPNVASTYRPTGPVKPEELKQLQTTVADTITALLENGKIYGDAAMQGEYEGALRELKEGSTTRAIGLLTETGELAPAMQQLFDYYPQLKNPQLPLGVFEPIRKALEVPSMANIPEQALQYLRANKDTPGVIEAFEEKYNVSAQEYL